MLCIFFNSVNLTQNLFHYLHFSVNLLYILESYRFGESHLSVSVRETYRVYAASTLSVVKHNNHIAPIIIPKGLHMRINTS